MLREREKEGQGERERERGGGYFNNKYVIRVYIDG